MWGQKWCQNFFDLPETLLFPDNSPHNLHPFPTFISGSISLPSIHTKNTNKKGQKIHIFFWSLFFHYITPNYNKEAKLKIKPLSDHSTLYGDGEYKSEADLQKLMSKIIKHHNLIPITITNISKIEKVSQIWNRRLLKKAMKLTGTYKEETDTIFIPNFHSNGFGLLELFNKDQLLNWKAYAKGMGRG